MNYLQEIHNINMNDLDPLKSPNLTVLLYGAVQSVFFEFLFFSRTVFTAFNTLYIFCMTLSQIQCNKVNAQVIEEMFHSLI